MNPVQEYVEKKLQAGEISFATMGDGAVLEMSDQALVKVLQNIVDPNMVAKFKRQIVVKVTITPSSDRTMMAYDIDVTTRLAGMDPVSGTADITSAGGRGVIAKARNQQLPMFDNMVPFQRSKD